jgi:hypothetical protein
MKLVPILLAVAGTVLVVPVLTGYAAVPAGPVASSFDAATITTLAANGIEQASGDAARAELEASDAAEVARRATGGSVRAAVLGSFTDRGHALAHRTAWQVLVEEAVLPDGERGRAWVAVDAETGEVLAAKPLLEIDAD